SPGRARRTSAAGGAVEPELASGALRCRSCRLLVGQVQKRSSVSSPATPPQWRGLAEGRGLSQGAQQERDRSVRTSAERYGESADEGEGHSGRVSPSRCRIRKGPLAAGQAARVRAS